MDRNELTAWLGDADLTESTRVHFYEAVDAYYDLPLHADRDPEERVADADEDSLVLSAILQSLEGEDTLESAADRTQRRIAEAKAELRAWVLASVALGQSENQISQKAGVNRTTVRSWSGK